MPKIDTEEEPQTQIQVTNTLETSTSGTFEENSQSTPMRVEYNQNSPIDLSTSPGM